MSGGSVCVYNYIFEFKIELSSDIKFMLVDNVDKKEQIFIFDFRSSISFHQTIKSLSFIQYIKSYACLKKQSRLLKIRL